MGEVVAERHRARAAPGHLAADAGPAAGRRRRRARGPRAGRPGRGSSPPCSHAVAGRGRRSKSIRIETEVEPATTLGDPRLLERLIGNLVENAIRHNVPAAGCGSPPARPRDKVWLHVANGGAVIPATTSTRCSSRSGAAAGCARRPAAPGWSGDRRLIVDAHGGPLQAAAPPFGGLALRIELPREHTDGARVRWRTAGRRAVPRTRRAAACRSRWSGGSGVGLQGRRQRGGGDSHLPRAGTELGRAGRRTVRGRPGPAAASTAGGRRRRRAGSAPARCAARRAR